MTEDTIKGENRAPGKSKAVRERQRNPSALTPKRAPATETRVRALQRLKIRVTEKNHVPNLDEGKSERRRWEVWMGRGRRSGGGDGPPGGPRSTASS